MWGQRRPGDQGEAAAWLGGEVAAVDGEDGAGDEAGGGRGQEQGGAGHLVGLAPAPQRRAAEQLRAAGGVVLERLR